MYDIESSIKYEPKYGIDNKTGNGNETFKSIYERYPWFVIDFEDPRTVERVILSIPESANVRAAGSSLLE